MIAEPDRDIPHTDCSNYHCVNCGATVRFLCGGEMTDTLAKWNPPCFTCTQWWQAERNVSCRDCCDLFKAYVSDMAEKNIEVAR
jgi:hypothetical protein